MNNIVTSENGEVSSTRVLGILRAAAEDIEFGYNISSRVFMEAWYGSGHVSDVYMKSSMLVIHNNVFNQNKVDINPQDILNVVRFFRAKVHDLENINSSIEVHGQKNESDIFVASIVSLIFGCIFPLLAMTIEIAEESKITITYACLLISIFSTLYFLHGVYHFLVTQND